MKAVDAKVLARFILRDDEAQTAVALSILERPVWVSTTVWVELGWVLHRRLRLDRATVADALSTVLMLSSVHVDDRVGIAWAIDRYRDGADWADAVHVVAARGAADAFVTFDRAMSNRLMGTPIPIETLA